MRRRDIERFKRVLSDTTADVDHYGLQHLLSSEWYFDRNAEIKGYNWAHAAADSLIHLGTTLKKFLEDEDKKDYERRRKRRRKRK